MELKDPNLLAALMASKKLSGRELSELVGWKSHTFLQRLLRGEVKTLKPDRALAIAHYLGVPTDVLFVTKVDGNPERSGYQSRPRNPAA